MWSHFPILLLVKPTSLSVKMYLDKYKTRWNGLQPAGIHAIANYLLKEEWSGIQFFFLKKYPAAAYSSASKKLIFQNNWPENQSTP